MNITTSFVDLLEDTYFDQKVYPTEKKVKKSQKPTRKERRQDQVNLPLNELFKLKIVKPITKNQSKVFDSFYSGKNIVCYGSAGTGKTFLSCSLAIKDVLEGLYEKLVIIRSAMSTRDIGFLPGSEKEKIEVYERPYIALFDEIFEKPGSYEALKKRGLVSFEPTSFLRGTTFNNSIIVIDEAQNMNFQEANTVITRVGKNSRILLCGDSKQNDLTKSKFDVSGFSDLISVLSHPHMSKDFDLHQFSSDDIVRSGLVKRFIETLNKLNL